MGVGHHGRTDGARVSEVLGMTRKGQTFAIVVGLIRAAAAIILEPLTGDMP